MSATDACATAVGGSSTDSSQSLPAKLKRARGFEPCPTATGDELYRNGIFEFNITRLMAFIEAHPERFPVTSLAVASTQNYGDSRLDQATIAAADISRPVLYAEIAPGRFNVIDGNHRMARARRDGVCTVPAYRINCPHHVAFLTSTTAYETYVDYWNGKVKEMQPKRPRASRIRAAHG